MTTSIDDAALLALVAEARDSCEATTREQARYAAGPDVERTRALCDAVEALTSERNDALDRERVLRNTLASDELQIKQWEARHAEMRGEYVRLAYVTERVRWDGRGEQRRTVGDTHASLAGAWLCYATRWPHVLSNLDDAAQVTCAACRAVLDAAGEEGE